MPLRRTLPAVLAALALAGCPSVDTSAPPERIAIATFDSLTSTIPLPNDVALQRAPAIPDAAGVQKELLLSFITGGGFPADQEVAITIPVTVKERQPDGDYGTPCPGVPGSRCGTPPAGIDLATVDDSSVALFDLAAASGPQRFLRCTASPTATACYEPGYADGVLTLRRLNPDGSRRWALGGRYVVALRNTIKTTDGLSLSPDATTAFVTANRPFLTAGASPQHALENQPLGGVPDTNGNGTNADEVESLEGLRSSFAQGTFWTAIADPATCTGRAGVPAPCWLPLPPGTPGIPALPAGFDVVGSVFPISDSAAIQSFTIQGSTVVRPLTDSGSGQVPLPSDFLLDPATGLVRNLPAFGPAAAGLATLDGFSTTAPLLIPLNGAVKAETITPATARMFEVTATGLVPVVGLSVLPGAAPPAGPPEVLVQPPTAIANGVSTSIVLAPAVPVEGGATNVYLPPLKEKAQYLVIVTSGVTDVQDRPMRRSTLMDLVFTFTGDLCAPATDLANCTSRIPGVANADAAGLQHLRASVGPVLDGLGLRDCSGGATCAVLAYTVKTQTVKDVSVLLSAAPYGIESAVGAAVFTPSGTAAFDPASVGIPATSFESVSGFLRTTFPTLYAIEGSSGALDPGFASWGPEEIQGRLRPLRAIVAAPTPDATASYPSCGPGGALKCVPLVVFQHGIGGAATQMLPVADALTAQGFVVAAIDLPYHGERAYCTGNDQCVQENGTDGVCTPDPSLQTPVDAAAPGTCTTGSLKPGDNLHPVASANFFVTANFFRIRDGIRQGLIDHSAATLALARAPVGMPQPQANDFATALAALGVAIDPTQVYFSGLSLGANFGASIVATNPRYSRAGLTATGATLVDVYTTGPANRSGLLPVFAALGIDLTKVSPVLEDGGPNPAFDPAQAARFAQTTAIAKWILDPAESINYAANVTTKSFHPDLAPLVAGGLGSATTAAYGQLVSGDQRFPEATSRFLFTIAGIPYTTYTSGGAIELPDRHELLLRNFLGPTEPRQQAGNLLRGDLAAFLASGTIPAAAQTIP